MATTMPERLSAPERKTLADVCGKDATRPKADVHPQSSATELRELAAEARVRTVKLESAADEIGIHPSRLSHKFSDGSVTLAQLEKLGAHYAFELGRQLVERYGPLSNPHDYADRLLLEAERLIFELKQYVSSRRVA